MSIANLAQDKLPHLLTDNVVRLLPPLSGRAGEEDLEVHVKFLTPDSFWVWLVSEGSWEESDFRFFGYVVGPEERWGNFYVSDLRSARGPLGALVERDPYFKPGPFSEVIAQYRDGFSTGIKKKPCSCPRHTGGGNLF